MNRITHYLDLTLYKAYADIKAEASRAYLGLLWWFLEPVLYMGVFFIVFQLGLRRGGADFVPFLLCGLVPWKWFSSTVAGGAGVLTKNAALMQQVYLPKLLLPLVQVVANTTKFTAIFLLLLMFMIFLFDRPVTVAWLALPAVLVSQLLFIMGVTSLVAGIVPFARDLRILLDNIIMMAFFASGIFFDIRDVHGELRDVLMLNPMAILITQYRTVLLDGVSPDWSALALVVIVALVFLTTGVAILLRFDRVYPKVVLK